MTRDGNADALPVTVTLRDNRPMAANRVQDASAGGFTLRPLVAGDARELTRIHRTEEVRRWWSDPDEEFPWEEPDATRWTVEIDGAVAGLIQFYEENEPRYRHASIDLFLDPAFHGQGLGTEVIRRTVAHLVQERGHHRITIDPAADNAAAIRCYEKVGFTTVGVMRAYERDPFGDAWHDGVLMELVVEGA
jgi:aminoglycoside 6'-N-acetyltransferase